MKKKNEKIDLRHWLCGQTPAQSRLGRERASSQPSSHSCECLVVLESRCGETNLRMIPKHAAEFFPQWKNYSQAMMLHHSSGTVSNYVAFDSLIYWYGMLESKVDHFNSKLHLTRRSININNKVTIHYIGWQDYHARVGDHGMLFLRLNIQYIFWGLMVE